MDEVKCERHDYVITKHGKPVSRLVPLKEEKPREIFGYMRGTAIVVGDILSPLDVELDAEIGYPL
jgi:antitoxin (DNA-binding transcriptional repressor) of toxin-antitoxin stability system